MESTSAHDIPLDIIATNGNDGVTYLNERVAANSTDGPSSRNKASETHRLLQNTGASNGEPFISDSDDQRTTNNCPKKSAICEVKKQLGQKVYKNIPLWVVILFLFVLIIAVIFISLALCSVIHEDVDEKFDRSLFDVPWNFSGSFILPNRNLTGVVLLNFDSSESQELVRELQSKLDDLYKTSPALGRYFSKSEIYEFSDDLVTAQYKLTFLLPAAEQDQLKRFTLSREMVYNVLRQFLYDQDTSEPGYINPATLTMTT